MALTTKPIFNSPKQFAADALRREKVEIYAIERVLPPLDTGDPVECLFHDGFKRPCTAFINEAGFVVEYHVGW